MAAVTDHRKLITDIRAGKLQPVYILIGTETYFIDLIVDELAKHAIAPDDRDFNYNLYYGNDTNAETVINCAQQFPVMADRKLVILKEAQGLQNAKADLDKFVPYISHPNYNTTLVITYTAEKTAAVTEIQKAANKSDAVVFKSESPRDYQLASFIKDYCQQHHMGIEDKAVEMLADYIGTPLSKLFGELSKLIQIKNGSGRITALDVEKNIGVSKDFTNYELLRAICRRDYPKCCQIIKYFRRNPRPNPTIVTAAMIFNYFSKITIAHFLPSKDDNSLMTVLDRKSPYFLKELKDAMRAYPPVKAVNAIHYLREFDSKNKGVNSFGNEYDLLQELIFKIMT